MKWFDIVSKLYLKFEKKHFLGDLLWDWLWFYYSRMCDLSVNITNLSHKCVYSLWKWCNQVIGRLLWRYVRWWHWDYIATPQLSYFIGTITQHLDCHISLSTLNRFHGVLFHRLMDFEFNFVLRIKYNLHIEIIKTRKW